MHLVLVQVLPGSAGRGGQGPRGSGAAAAVWASPSEASPAREARIVLSRYHALFSAPHVWDLEPHSHPDTASHR